jgi:integrase
MPRITRPLTDTEIRQAKPKEKEYTLSDGNGLNLRVKPAGSKIWLFNYTSPKTSKRNNIGLGNYPDVSLQGARAKAKELRSVIADEIDPKDHRASQERERDRLNNNTLAYVAAKWLDLKKIQVKPQHHAKIKERFDKHILPKMGKTPLHEITAVNTISILQPLADSEKFETVKKLCGILNQIMVYAVNSGLTHSNPLSGISKAFPPPKATNMPTLKPEALPELMFKIQHSNAKLITRCLLEWQLHTMVRPAEAAGTRWKEIDFDKALWKMPAGRMKGGERPHTVPLSPQAMKLLEVMKPISGKFDHVFPKAQTPREPANSQTVNNAIKRMGFKGKLVSHGLRALASTTLNEQGFHYDLIEAALAHRDEDNIRGIYNRAEYIEQRRPMMEWWSSHIDSCAAGNPVVLTGHQPTPI